MIKTESVLVQDLCVPCGCACRYCLLSWDGKCVGAEWGRGTAFALRMRDWVAENREELDYSFTFGYSMEHPRLREALRFLRDIGSPQAEFLQCDGMRMRDAAQCRDLAALFAEEGVRKLNFTLYGLGEYHDRFAGRRGDFEQILRMMRAGEEAGLEISVGVPLTEENACQAEALCKLVPERTGCGKISLRVPHSEGRGVSLDGVRLRESTFEGLPVDLRARMNRAVFRPEREWLADPSLGEERGRMLIVSLRRDNIARYETMDPGALIDEIEALDEAYYAAFPSFAELAVRYGRGDGEEMFSRRDLFAHYRAAYGKEFSLSPYDVTDERQSGSRRF